MDLQGISSSVLTKESIVSKLILQIEAMSKKPQVDARLSEALDRLLQKVEESDKYLDNGIFNINFAEVALFLQGAVQLYGKKVDLLWEQVFEYQHKIISLEKESAEKEQAETLARERQIRYKRKRKFEETKEQADITQLLQLSYGIQNSNLRTCESLQTTWTYAQMKGRSCYENVLPGDEHFRGSQFMIKSAIHSDCENQVSSNKMKINSSVFQLSQVYPVFVGKCLEKSPSSITHLYEHDEVLQQFLAKQELDMIEMEKLHRDEYKSYFSEYLTMKRNSPPENHNMLCPKRLLTHVKRLSEDVLQQYLKKDPTLMSIKIKRASSTAPESGADDIDDSGFFDFADDAEVNSEPTLCNVSEGDVCSSYAQQSEDTSGITVVGAESVLTPCEVESVNKSVSDVTEEIKEANERSRSCRVRKTLSTEFVQENKKTKSSTYLEAQAPKAKRAKTVQLRIKCTAPLDAFEKFVNENYKVAEGEGVHCTEEETTQANLKSVDINALQDSTFSSCEPQKEKDLTSSTVAEDTGFVDDFDSADCEDSVVPEDADAESLSLKELAALNQPSSVISKTIMQRIEEERKQKEKVEEWKNFITKKLDKTDEKSDFDIHFYGSQIMDNISQEENRNFKDVVKGKNASEVSRYFLAVLQLACTQNVEMIHPSDGRPANDSLELKLLSRECYHEHLANYTAPSEETFSKRLAKVKARSFTH